MTEHQNGKRSWGAKQNWIKDALTKSGTELVDVSRSKTKAAQKKQQTSAKGKSRESSRNVAQEGGGNKFAIVPPHSPTQTPPAMHAPFCFGIRTFFLLTKIINKAREREKEREREKLEMPVSELNRFSEISQIWEICYEKVSGPPRHTFFYCVVA